MKFCSVALHRDVMLIEHMKKLYAALFLAQTLYY